MFDCCHCGEGDCGCRGCFSCNACLSCLSDNNNGPCDRMAVESVTVQKWKQPKIGNLPFTHNSEQDKTFSNRTLANEYIAKADSGICGDERFRYQIIPTE